MTIRSALKKALKYRQDRPAGRVMIHIARGLEALVFVWYDKKWHIRPQHGLVGLRTAPLVLLLEGLKAEGGYIDVTKPPFRESDREKEMAWRQVYLVRIEPGGETYEMEITDR